ncbi:hypothetical protein C5167_044370 [Papaver somniferum]|uniref:Secreted protein n=1 Tax=Papaver somniferum TaxID=3469 RepID=A0A4Y7LBX6_PAPSO|nr:hypothetical protein C5167_044370 [Papaver somniferum]
MEIRGSSFFISAIVSTWIGLSTAENGISSRHSWDFNALPCMKMPGKHGNLNEDQGFGAGRSLAIEAMTSSFGSWSYVRKASKSRF